MNSGGNTFDTNGKSKKSYSIEAKADITKAVDKVSMTLAKSGGTIASAGVTMYGIPSTKTRKRSTEEKNYLTENGVC